MGIPKQHGRRLTIYGNWSAYDELSDGVPLTEELAMKQFDELLRLRAHGVRFDAYLMDAFWFAPDGGYRTWRQPHWPNGPQRWLDACKANGIIPGLWFTANTLCQLEPAEAWLDSADENKWGLCCFHGGFLSDYLDVLGDWYEQGIRIFKLDFADFTAAPPQIKSELSAEEIRSRNIDALRNGLREFRASHPDAIFMAFNGFESKEYMDRTDRPLEKVIDLQWLEVFDSIYSGDPRPADVPTYPFWRSVDIYGDHTTRILEFSGVPLERIDNCGFMAGPTGTCYWRGKAMWRGMLILTLARGGDLTVLYGDLSQFDEGDARWMATVQRLFEDAFESGSASSFGGLPGEGNPYGWVVGGKLCVVVNPQPVVGICPLPEGDWQLQFSDAGFNPSIAHDSIALAPFQMALMCQTHWLDDLWASCLSYHSTKPLPSEGAVGEGEFHESEPGEGAPVSTRQESLVPFLGVQTDCISQVRRIASYKTIERTPNRLLVEVDSGKMLLIVQQRQDNGRLVRKYEAKRKASEVLSIAASQNGQPIPTKTKHDRVIWSGISWAAAEIFAKGDSPVQIEIKSGDPDVTSLDLQVWRRDPEA